MQKKGINIVALTSKNATIDKEIWKNVGGGVYSVVLASPEIFFQLTSMFWLSIIREISNAFCQQLACITVDQAHLI